ncbi:MAG: FkbM family methyltransferase, partial [Lentisphaeria bacterium]|nr:FkbM family methyltransferase [Lentisphaeria bacterium]
MKLFIQEFIEKKKLKAPKKINKAENKDRIEQLFKLYEEVELKTLGSVVSLSQVGQDIWVFGEVFNEKKEGFFLDVGAHDGIELSNTYLLEKRYNWDGICIEANPISYGSLNEVRSVNCIQVCIGNEGEQVSFSANGLFGGIVGLDNKEDPNSIMVNTRSLANILKENNAPNIIDYLSIDIEGAEDLALLNFPYDTYTFLCLTIERPSQNLRECLKNNGYILIKELPVYCPHLRERVYCIVPKRRNQYESQK